MCYCEQALQNTFLWVAVRFATSPGWIETKPHCSELKAAIQAHLPNMNHHAAISNLTKTRCYT